MLYANPDIQGFQLMRILAFWCKQIWIFPLLTPPNSELGVILMQENW
jgi:hypothetical protein